MVIGVQSGAQLPADARGFSVWAGFRRTTGGIRVWPKPAERSASKGETRHMGVSSTMRMLLPLAIVALLTLAPVMAQETQADPDCPEGQTATPEGCSEPTECDADVCDTPMTYGNESCIECSGPVDDPRPLGNESCIE